MRTKLSVIIFLISFAPSFSQQILETPAWAKDLIIYEIAPKGFTSPDGPESGTFNSLKEKIPYLKDLGVNGIWLTGYSWSDTSHFYGIWTQYACIRPDSIDASLGTPDDFRKLIEKAHDFGIRIFLDVITHGVMKNSPLIKQHPLWFKGGSWGMIDYDWFGLHKDLDDWWVNTWVNYVETYGVDGFRLDCDIYRPDLWAAIKYRSKMARHEIVVFEEGPVRFSGATDFRQYSINLASHEGLVLNHPFLKDVCDYLNRYYDYERSRYQIKINYKHKESELIQANDKRILSISFSETPVAGYDQNSTEIQLAGIPKSDSISKITVTRLSEGFDFYEMNYTAWANDKNKHPNWPAFFYKGRTLFVKIPDIPPMKEITSLQISCHDGGWEGFSGVNPYTVQGSRCVMGYSGLLSPALPIFFSGEEFNSHYRPLPRLCSNLYGDTSKTGSKCWMYGAWLDWSQLDEQDHADMFNDVKKMIMIRKQQKALMNGDYFLTHILSLEYKCEQAIPIPYVMWNEDKAIVVAGNNTDEDVSCTIFIPIYTIGLKEKDEVIVTDLWNDVKKQVYSAKNIHTFSFTIKKDKVAKGGLAIFMIEKKIGDFQLQ